MDYSHSLHRFDFNPIFLWTLIKGNKLWFNELKIVWMETNQVIYLYLFFNTRSSLNLTNVLPTSAGSKDLTIFFFWQAVIIPLIFNLKNALNMVIMSKTHHMVFYIVISPNPDHSDTIWKPCYLVKSQHLFKCLHRTHIVRITLWHRLITVCTPN